MRRFEEELQARKNYLEELIKEKEKAVIKSPEGSLIINKNRGRAEYYYKTEPMDTHGKYIRKKSKLPRVLAQKDYDKKVLQAASKEKEFIEKVLKTCPETIPEEIFPAMDPFRQDLVTPILLPDDRFVDEWQNQEYERKGFSMDLPEFYSDKGERMRSKSEVLIANELRKRGVPYHYEKPIILDTDVVWHPDFTILNVETRKEYIWEHLGMMDDPGYMDDVIARVNVYAKNGYLPGDKLILTMESRKRPINQKLVAQMIDHFCLSLY